MSLKINWIERKKSAKGIVYAKANLEDGRDVTIFADFPDFENLRPGTSIEGDVKVSFYKNKQSFTLMPLSKPGPSVPRVQPAQERVEKSIAKTLDRKEENMERMATFRDATLLTVAWANKQDSITKEDIESMWVNLRKWLETKIGEPFN